MDRLGSQFLHEKNPRLHHSREIEVVVGYLRANGEKIPNEPAAKIQAYLGLLAHEQYVNDGILTGDPESTTRQVEAGVISINNFPESYFELQKKIDCEKGDGLRDIPPDYRASLVEFIQADQRGSLAVWAEHLTACAYPDWFTYYAWTSA